MWCDVKVKFFTVKIRFFTLKIWPAFYGKNMTLRALYAAPHSIPGTSPVNKFVLTDLCGTKLLEKRPPALS